MGHQDWIETFGGKSWQDIIIANFGENIGLTNQAQAVGFLIYKLGELDHQVRELKEEKKQSVGSETKQTI